MGVYHLMGLGRSPGTVIGPITYLAHRYPRWSPEDQAFFARSGEARHQAAGRKVGDIQALVLFTTREILDGTLRSFDYVDNPPGRVSTGPSQRGGPMKAVLRALLRQEWPAIRRSSHLRSCRKMIGPKSLEVQQWQTGKRAAAEVPTAEAFSTYPSKDDRPQRIGGRDEGP
ncbi:hypothetical protein HRbin22_00835 [Candidatus Thermoflexus japonica]|uniref:Uncharacterized protein n=1 Tax=Candidatus Thermoflexus japonica TaxID=2035417 RepID=A0A2H5Y580_9CHLR|nr:hypothetical protein HRbin22_00835 [Candidatus Thermoflexus japonica]